MLSAKIIKTLNYLINSDNFNALICIFKKEIYFDSILNLVLISPTSGNSGSGSESGSNPESTPDQSGFDSRSELKSKNSNSFFIFFFLNFFL